MTSAQGPLHHWPTVLSKLLKDIELYIYIACETDRTPDTLPEPRDTQTARREGIDPSLPVAPGTPF